VVEVPKLRSLGAIVGLLLGTLIPLSETSLAADTVAPRMTGSQMQDLDGNNRSDSLLLTYSEKIKHPFDGDGNYPFSVDGYKVIKVKGADGTTKKLSLVLKELGAPDLSADPDVTYTRTNNKPVRDRADNQARNQTFTQTTPLDPDGDGIPSATDQCDDDPEDDDGFEDSDGCPDPDNDEDGINDDVDNCVNEAEDADGFEDADGCPDPDNDGDGVLDGADPGPNDPCVPEDSGDDCDPDADGLDNATDQCDSQAEDADGFEDGDGCPDPDNDSDGINDDVDQCDSAAEDVDGHQDSDGCPEPDNDGDGVLDGADDEPDNPCVPDDSHASCDPDGDGMANATDQCDNEAEDADGFEDSDGCPDPDNDSDEINDDVDQCDNAAEDEDGFEDADGCPDPDNDGDGTLDGEDAEPNNPCVPDDSGDDCDPDDDGFSANEGDCAPTDPAINPSAVDEPDLDFADTNCDGVDGTASNAIFVSTTGNDANPGTKAQPVSTVGTGVGLAVAATPSKDVYVATGDYNGTVGLATGVGIFGGYSATDWSRSLSLETKITGSPEGAVANGDTDVLLQLLTIKGEAPAAPGSSAYGLRAVSNSDVTLEKAKVVAGDAAEGAMGITAGNTPSPGTGFGGGSGGSGGLGTGGTPGGPGGGPLAGGGGPGGPYNTNGGSGGSGGPGLDGTGGSGGTLALAGAGATWNPAVGNGQAGSAGTMGSGGGGGGGGGGYQVTVWTPYSCNCGFFGCSTCYYSTTYYYYGGDGGPGGAGGGAGTGGSGGNAGGGSFGVYVHDSTLTVLGCDVQSGKGGGGGVGRNGGAGGSPTGGVAGVVSSGGDGGPGGPGGQGGDGGGGGGGAGGPSIPIFLAGTTSEYNDDALTTLAPDTAGTGGAGGTSPGNAGQAGGNGVSQPIYPP
jgi:hypothetical protein